MTIQHIIEFDNLIKDIRSTSSSNSKIELLKTIHSKPKDYQEFVQNVFNLTYNPQVRFYLKPFKSDKFNLQETSYENIFQLLEQLNKRIITGDDARIAYLSYVAQADNQAEIDLLNNILDKDLKAGFSASTINKVFKGLIPEVPYMRCSLLDAITDATPWMKEVISQEKMDGMFVNIDIDEDGNVELTSRAGSSFVDDSGAFTNIVELMSKVFDKGYQYHGELLMIDNENGTYLPREISNGLFNAILKNATKTTFDPEKYTVSVSLWDKIPFALLAEDKPELSEHNAPYVNRLDSLNKNINVVNEYIDMYDIDVYFDIIKTVDTRTYPNIVEAEKHFREMLSEGKEGTIVKLPSMLWRDGTSKNQVKLKNRFEIELEVKEFLKGTGKNEQYFGSIRCESSDGLLSVNVPVSGFSDTEKKEISDNRDQYIGKILTVQANSIMYSKKDNKQHSLFLPVQGGFREDKTVADDMERIENQFTNSINLAQKMDELLKKKKTKKLIHK